MIGRDGKKEKFILEKGIPTIEVANKIAADKIAENFEGSIRVHTSVENKSYWYYDGMIQASMTQENKKKKIYF